jgi:hypothetical protein
VPLAPHAHPHTAVAVPKKQDWRMTQTNAAHTESRTLFCGRSVPWPFSSVIKAVPELDF